MCRRVFLAGLLVVTAVIGVPLGSQLLAYSSATAASPVDDVPSVTNLDPALRDALRRAATDAADDGVELVVESGWRSPEHQQQLLRRRRREVRLGRRSRPLGGDRPTTSAHVSGDAVDIGPSAATAWLSEHGVAYGLCQIYGNEPWHYELRVEAVERGCPPAYADPTHDPRMQQ